MRGITRNAGWMLIAALIALTPAVLAAQETSVAESAVTISSKVANLHLELTDGTTHSIELKYGDVWIDGKQVGSYTPGGEMEQGWREFLVSRDAFDAEALSARIRDWEPSFGGADEATAERMASMLRTFLSPAVDVAAELGETATMPGPNGQQLMIAPRFLALDDLTLQIDRLEASLDRLGESAAGAGEDVALVVHDDYTLTEGMVVAGDVALLDGDLELLGIVEGDVLVLNGELTLGSGARVEGDVLQVGGEVDLAGGVVMGELLSITGFADAIEFEVDVPVIADAIALDAPIVIRGPHGPGFFARIGNNVGRTFSGLMSVLAFLVAMGALGFVTVYFFRGRLEVVADTVRADMLRSFGVGVAGQLLFFPILLVLVVAIVTWLVLPVYVVGTGVALVVGYLAVAHAAGESFQNRRYDWAERWKFTRRNSYSYVLNGLLILVVPFAIGSVLFLLGGLTGIVRGLTFFAGGVLTWLAVTTGLGAVILTRGGKRDAYVQASGMDMDDAWGGGGFSGEEKKGA